MYDVVEDGWPAIGLSSLPDIGCLGFDILWENDSTLESKVAVIGVTDTTDDDFGRTIVAELSLSSRGISAPRDETGDMPWSYDGCGSILGLKGISTHMDVLLLLRRRLELFEALADRRPDDVEPYEFSSSLGLANREYRENPGDCVSLFIGAVRSGLMRSELMMKVSADGFSEGGGAS
eukprot:881230_1